MAKCSIYHKHKQCHVTWQYTKNVYKEGQVIEPAINNPNYYCRNCKKITWRFDSLPQTFNDCTLYCIILILMSGKRKSIESAATLSIWWVLAHQIMASTQILIFFQIPLIQITIAEHAIVIFKLQIPLENICAALMAWGGFYALERNKNKSKPQYFMVLAIKILFKNYLSRLCA